MQLPVSMLETPNTRPQALWSITHLTVLHVFTIWLLVAAIRQINSDSPESIRDLAVPFIVATASGAVNALLGGLRQRRGSLEVPEHPTAGGRITTALLAYPYCIVRAQGQAARLLGLPAWPLQVIQSVLLAATVTLSVGVFVARFL